MKQRIVQSILILLGGIFGVWFLIPYFKYGIMNIGNITGIIVCTIFILYGLCIKRTHCFVGFLWKRTLGKVLLCVVGGGITLIVAFVLIFSIFMIRAANNEPTREETVVVLGCRVYKERASLMLLERLEVAYQYLSEHEEAVCILSGGQGSGENISEAECMYRYLTNKGIEPDRLYKEESSTSTRENIEFSKRMIEQYQLNPNLAIVTNEFHEYRASKIADSFGLTATSIPGKTAWWLFPTYYVRELYGIMYEYVF